MRYRSRNDKPASGLQINDKLTSHLVEMLNGKFFSFQNLMLINVLEVVVLLNFL